jgi:hypothetical protein
MSNNGDVFARLQQNIDDATKDPTIPLNARIFEEARLLVKSTFNERTQPNFLPSLVALLPTLQQGKK